MVETERIEQVYSVHIRERHYIRTFVIILVFALITEPPCNNTMVNLHSLQNSKILSRITTSTYRIYYCYHISRQFRLGSILFPSKNKKRPTYGLFLFFGGDGENRTLVQTSVIKLSTCLVYLSFSQKYLNKRKYFCNSCL